MEEVDKHERIPCKDPFPGDTEGKPAHPFCSAPIKLYILNVCDIIHHHHRWLIQKFCLLDFPAALDALDDVK